jgi:hypothetical protein
MLERRLGLLMSIALSIMKIALCIYITAYLEVLKVYSLIAA